MDPITTTILAAIASGATKFVGTALEDAYTELKTIIRRKYGQNSDVFQAVKVVEANPKDSDLRDWLQAEIVRARLYRDDEIRNAAQGVRHQVERMPTGAQIIKVIQDGGMVFEKDVTIAGPSQWAGRDFHSGPRYTVEASGPGTYQPKSAIGWLIVIPGVASAVVGAAICGLAITGSGGNSDKFDLGFQLLFLGIIVTIVGEFIDRAVSD